MSIKRILDHEVRLVSSTTSDRDNFRSRPCDNSVAEELSICVEASQEYVHQSSGHLLSFFKLAAARLRRQRVKEKHVTRN